MASDHVTIIEFCNSAAMTLHSEGISGVVAPDAHAVLVMDQAGWYFGQARPACQYLHPYPAVAFTRVNPVENIWQFLRDNWLSIRVFSSHDDISIIYGEDLLRRRPGKSTSM